MNEKLRNLIRNAIQADVCTAVESAITSSVETLLESGSVDTEEIAESVIRDRNIVQKLKSVVEDVAENRMRDYFDSDVDLDTVVGDAIDRDCDVKEEVERAICTFAVRHVGQTETFDTDKLQAVLDERPLLKKQLIDAIEREATAVAAEQVEEMLS